MTTTARDDLGALRALRPDEIEALPWEPLAGAPGVWSKVLWQSGEVVVGLARVEPGASKPPHVHPAAHHHVWVLEGSATMAGSVLSAGSYLHVPAGTRHEVTDVGEGGCTFFYTYRPSERP